MDGISLLLFLGYPPNSFVGKSPIAFWKFPEYFPLHCQGLAPSPSMEIPTLSYRKFPLRLCRIFSFVGWFPSVFQAFPSWLPGPGGVEDPVPEEQVGRSGAGCWLLPQGPAAPAGRGAEACLFTFIPQCFYQCRVVSLNRWLIKLIGIPPFQTFFFFFFLPAWREGNLSCRAAAVMPYHLPRSSWLRDKSRKLEISLI